MHHRNAPLTDVGRQRAVAQVVEVGRPIAYVSTELHIARATLSKWVGRFREHGELGLEDRSSALANRPILLPVRVLELIDFRRRKKKWSVRRIARKLADGHGFICSVRTETRWLDRLGLNRIRNVTPDGENLRSPGKIIARYPGHVARWCQSVEATWGSPASSRAKDSVGVRKPSRRRGRLLISSAMVVR